MGGAGREGRRRGKIGGWGRQGGKEVGGWGRQGGKEVGQEDIFTRLAKFLSCSIVQFS